MSGRSRPELALDVGVTFRKLCLEYNLRALNQQFDSFYGFKNNIKRIFKMSKCFTNYFRKIYNLKFVEKVF